MMIPLFKHNLVRDVRYKNFIENFMVSAISSIFIIRVFLSLTGFPQIGRHGIHIAHMLWGGFFMSVAILISLIFLNNFIKNIVSILGGIGFGIFIDELGKFITSSNDYFFKPTFSLIYIIFILVYLFMRYLRKRDITSKEYLINSFEFLKEAVILDLDKNEREKGLEYLNKTREKGSFVAALRDFYQKAVILPETKANLFVRIGKKFRDLYFKLTEKNGFSRFIIGFFILKAIVSIIVGLFLSIEAILLFFNIQYFLPGSGNLQIDYFDLISFAATIASSILIIDGVINIWRSKIKAYGCFKYSLLIAIFIEQIFAFYSEQLQAVLGLIINLLILIAINFMIEKEKEKAYAISS